MSATASDVIRVSFSLRLESVASDDKTPPMAAYAFDITGGFLTAHAVADNQVSLVLPARFANQTVRFFFGPPQADKATPTIAALTRNNAYELRQRVVTAAETIALPISDAIWRLWLFCPCTVTGQVVTTVTLPNGTTKQLPVCNARVNICEVWALPIIIWRLPEPILLRLRDELVTVITQPFPPPPPPGQLATNAALALPKAPAVAAAIPMLRPPGSTLAAPASLLPRETVTAAALPAIADAQTMNDVRALAASISVADIRNKLVTLGPILLPYFCWWEWLEPWLVVDCFETVTTDSNGNFSATIWYPCVGPTPNLYFSVEQLQGANWVSVYQPFVRCGTYWTYACGSKVVLNVTDPAVIPCAPPETVTPPAGTGSWVLVTAVGGTYVWGTGRAGPAPAGWVQPDGLTDYGSIVNAPFGGYLGFRSGASIDIPRSGAMYYRWSYRMLGTSQWFPMTDPVVRHYVKETPPALPTFPVEVMGPLTVNGVSALYMFKPLNPPPPSASDPAGTITYWPNDDLFADIYSGFLDTTSLPGGAAAAAGVYQVMLEVFDQNAAPVVPGSGTFRFIVPQSVAADGSVTARAADPSEMIGDGYVFNLHIDNNPCTASTDAPAIGGGGTVDACGFLTYTGTSQPITIAFHAKHPNEFATFSFEMVRGVTDVAVADVPGGTEVAAVSAGAYAGDGVGDFTHGFTVGALLDSCVNGAFAESLYVSAKATTGWGDRISAYDAPALRAFALAAS